ncbi:hypothetical protein [Paenibacillus sp. Soil522]|uniref:hypothetical protein n=1 Tax=Paenibacillus sp. Soil522 TaxID=1736388 RepID=UPI0006FD772C|nr:hypothetical protein [Paenibacillus sp. Soil522]KRE22705.1 hypothetical protein ASG81_28500 [Paenibacillus sp. Soil522]
MTQIFDFINDDLPINSVSYLTDDFEVDLFRQEIDKWVLNDNIINSHHFYYLKINGKTIIPDIRKKFKMRNKVICSINEGITKDVNSIVISNLFCCENLVYSNDTKLYHPVNRISVLNNSQELVNIWCDFENVKFDFLMFLEIYSEDEIFDIIPVIIEASTKERDYKKSYFCCFSINHFSKSKLWNIRVRTSLSNKREMAIKFNYLKAQSYSPSTIKGGN